MSIAEPPTQVRCEIHTNWMVGSSGKCGRREMCRDHGRAMCGEILLYEERMIFLNKVKSLKAGKK